VRYLVHDTFWYKIELLGSESFVLIVMLKQ